jgi:protein-ribulosamine 3-kinase
MDLKPIEHSLAERCGIVSRGRATPVAGSSSAGTFALPTGAATVFLKVVEASRSWAIEAEAAGLAALAQARSLAVPGVLDCGVAGRAAYLALEWIDLVAAPAAAHECLGRGLARQHRHFGAAFGWQTDTSLGTTRQPNTPDDDWARFFAEQRLGFQLELAALNGAPRRVAELGARLGASVPELLGPHEPLPSLLHGDLWSGNWGADAAGNPYVFDPSVYYGDREADLALARLFGGFAPGFYAAYSEEWPLAAGWEQRSELYELYHLLNHFNLFGPAYLPSVVRVLERLTGAATS